MITITGAVIQQFRTLVRKGLGLTKRRPSPKVHFEAGRNGLRVCVQTADVVVEYWDAGQDSSTNFAVSFDLFREFTAGKATDVSLRMEGRELVASWHQAGIPQGIRLPVQKQDALPPIPENWRSNSSELLTAIRDSCGTADSESGRYALSHLRLRGSDGQVAATDGRQLLAVAGFSFPWEGEILIPTSKIFDCADLIGYETVDAGMEGNWAVFRTGPWKVWLKIDRASRFPEIDSLLSGSSESATVLTLAEPDAEFLRQSLKHLPGGDDHNSPLTFDLNGAVTVRSKAGDAEKVTEVILARSERDGQEVRFAANRRFVARAIELGFRKFQIGKPESPVIAQTGNRSFLWANLMAASVIPPTANAVRIESPGISPSTVERYSRPQSQRPAKRTPLRLEKIIAALRSSAETMSRLLHELEHSTSPCDLSSEQLRATDA
ncbi:hypothetical protein GC197_09925 [bacterium]|nr:hypothetical protein [bacterium]